jgi:hypothetical protein
VVMTQADVQILSMSPKGVVTAKETILASDADSTMSKRFGLSRNKWTRYQQLFRDLDLPRGLSRDGKIVWLRMDVPSTLNGDSDKGVVFSPSPLKPCVLDLDNYKPPPTSLDRTVVYSGSHLHRILDAERPPEMKIVDVLLTPGSAPTVCQSAFIAPQPRIRWSACSALYEDAFIGQDGCVDGLKTNPLARSRSAELLHLMASRRTSKERFSSAFLADPSRTAASYSVLPGTDGLKDFLRLIAQHPDRKLAARAKTELSRLNNH